MIISIKDRGFRRWLTHQYYTDNNTAIGNNAVNNALNVIEAKACFTGKQYTLHNRVCWHEGAIWYDLGNWEAVRITPEGWEFVKEPPILFKHYTHQKSHDTYQIESNGDTTKILDFINIKDKKLKILFVVYLVSCFIPEIPHIIVCAHGSKGATKSTFLKIIKSLVDPSTLKQLSFPKDKMELIQLLSHHYYAPFDNVSHLSDGQSDALCRASTGEGVSKREIFSNDQDIIYSFLRCIGINGINIVATKPDLLDRSILIELERLSERERKPEKELWRDFNLVKGNILGGIFSILSKAMKLYPNIHLQKLPRMADFTLWGCAIAEALGNTKEEFLEAYFENIKTQNKEAIEGSPIGGLVLEFMEDKSEWSGKSTEFLEIITNIAHKNKIDTKAKDFPKSPKGLFARLKEIKANLVDEGIGYIQTSDGIERKLTIFKLR